MYPAEIPFPKGAGSTPNPGGRPKRVGGPIVLHQPNAPSGFEFSSDKDSSAFKAAQQKYMKAGTLPPALTPKRSRPQQNRTNKAISRGWVNPRSFSG